MLVLSCVAGRSILIGDNIRVTVVAVSHTAAGSKVRLGFEAPPEMLVARRELYERGMRQPPAGHVAKAKGGAP